jgi:hypothetical protein
MNNLTGSGFATTEDSGVILSSKIVDGLDD